MASSGNLRFFMALCVVTLFGLLTVGCGDSGDSGGLDDAAARSEVLDALQVLASEPFSVRTAYGETLDYEATKAGEDAVYGTGYVDLATGASVPAEDAGASPVPGSPEAVVVDDVVYLSLGARPDGESLLMSADRNERAGLVSMLPPLAVIHDVTSWVQEGSSEGKDHGESGGLHHWSVELSATLMTEHINTLVEGIEDPDERLAAELALQNDEIRHVPTGSVHVWVNDRGFPERVGVELHLKAEGSSFSGALSYYPQPSGETVKAEVPEGDPAGVSVTVAAIEDITAEMNSNVPAGEGSTPAN